MTIDGNLTSNTPLRRIRGGEIPVPNPVPWRVQRRQTAQAAAPAGVAGRQRAWWPPHVSLDAVVALTLSLSMLFILQLGSRGAALIVGLTPLYLFMRRRDAVAALGKRWFLLVAPAFAVLSTFWSQSPAETLRFAVELVITLTAALLLSSAARPRAVIGAFALAFVIYVVDAVLHGQQVTIGVGAGGSAFSGLSSSKNLMADIAATGLLFAIAAVLSSLSNAQPLAAAIFCAAIPPQLFALVSARSAGALLAVGVGLSAFCALAVASKTPRPVRISLVLIVALVAGVIALNYSTFSSALIDVGARAFDKDPTLTGRTYLWYRAGDTMAQAPLLGNGYSAFWIQGNIDAEGLWRYAGILGRSGFSFHNTLVELRVGLGWIGAALFFGTLLVGALLLVRRFVEKPTLPLVLWSSIMLYEISRMGIESLGLQPLYYSTFLLFIALGTGVAPEPAGELPGKRQRVSRPAIGVVSYVEAEMPATSLRLRRGPPAERTAR